MKKSLKYLVFFSAATFALTNCENPTIDNKLPYYYYETIAYLPASGTQSVNILHTPTTIQGKEIVFSVARSNNDSERMEKELQKDCTVELEATFEGIEPDYITFRDGLSLTIPAGQTSVSSAIDIDWSFATEQEAEYTITLSIKNSNVTVSQERYSTIYEITKNRKPESNLYTNAPPTGTNEDRSGWTVQYSTN